VRRRPTCGSRGSRRRRRPAFRGARRRFSIFFKLLC
jgi:hypothetical protein